ncbi:MAG: type I-C CRISPR-associated protein Cas5c [Planctomycetaceae bacterium]|jgi:CRISPR-associated protein Cas5d|nr:type I-C CRISPR-associated protein Cas5c [Planctomycetaceae bacterium]
MSRGFWLEVSGNFACFTRPEMKVERVSYDVITPSAARAIFEAIFWKPAIYWIVKEIQVLKPIHWISVRRNEVAKVASKGSDGIYIEDERQQRAGLFLRDVKYRLRGEFVFIPPEKRQKSRFPVPEFLLQTDSEEYKDWQEYPNHENRKDETEAKYAAMFERRAKKGQHFTKPYLGCREFAADVTLIDPAKNPAEPVKETCDLGWMLYDLDYSDPLDIKPLFFRAEMKNGVIIVPDRNSEEVKG